MANIMYNKSELKEDVFQVRCAKKMADEAAKRAGEHLPNMDRPCHRLPALMQIGTIESHSRGAVSASIISPSSSPRAYYCLLHIMVLSTAEKMIKFR